MLAALIAETALRSKLIVLAVLAGLLALIWLRPLDDLAERHVESGLQRALATFAVARTLNAVLSVVQSAAVGAQVGVGGSFHPGAALEPLDDLVEQFSAIMLAATLSFALQGLMVNIAAAWPVSTVLSVLLLGWAIWRFQDRPVSRWLPRLALGLLCLRLSVPLLALASEAAYQLVLASDYARSQKQIEVTRLPDDEARPGESFMDRAKRWWAQNTEISKKIDELRNKAEGVVEHVIRLSAIFILQTIVIPLLFYWFVLWLYRVLIRAALAPPPEPKALRAPVENSAA